MDGPRRRFSTFSISSSMEVCISLLISFYYYCHGLILCIIIEFNSCFTVRSLIFVFRREIQKLKPEVFVFFSLFRVVDFVLCFKSFHSMTIVLDSNVLA